MLQNENEQERAERQILQRAGFTDDKIDHALEAARFRMAREERLGLKLGWWRDLMPRVLPASWRVHDGFANGLCWTSDAGLRVTAIQVFPRSSQYVNVHEFCLHLFTCLDGEILGSVLPDFTAGTGAI